jgi:serine/threonine-protein kinase
MRHQPGDVIDGYRIGAMLGEGGFAESYDAEDSRDGHRVVLKVLKGNVVGDPRAARRFRQELSITGALDHPGVQQSHDDGRNRTELYLVLDYVDGASLSAWLHGHPAGVPAALAIAWGRELAETLVYLEGRRVVHGDLKPGNLLVGDDEHLTLLDFGAAGPEPRGWGARLPFGTEVGTAAYASPERLQGRRGDRRSDLYSWGVVMYELLTGRPPFHGATPEATMEAQLTDTPTPIHELRGDVPAPLEAVVLKSMRRSPTLRYQSAAELLDDLGRLESLDPASFDLSPEPPLAVSAVGGKSLLLVIGVTALGFFVVAGATIGISIALH